MISYLILETFASIGSIIPNVINLTNNHIDLISTQALPKETKVTNKTVDGRANALDFRTDPINLTALGIKCNNGLNEYTSVELPGFKLNFLNGAAVVDYGKKWGAKMSEGEGDYAQISRFVVENSVGNRYTGMIERKHSLWYDSNGNYNLALVYRLTCDYLGPGGVIFYGRVQGELGSVVKFY